MVQINFAQKQVNAKIVYYGPGMSGKTTNLEVIHQRAPEGNRGDLTSISTDGDRTLFFDFMPLDLGTVAGMRTCFQIYTVPGQVYYNSTRKLVLQGVDGVIFVADSSPNMMEENLESMKNLEANLIEYGRSIEDLPMVIQYNKRDIEGALPIETLEEQLNTRGAPAFEGIANTGQGVFPTLKAVAACVLDSLHQQQTSGGAMASPPPVAEAPQPAPAPPAAPAAEAPAVQPLGTAAAPAPPAPAPAVAKPAERATITMSQTGFHKAPSVPLPKPEEAAQVQPVEPVQPAAAAPASPSLQMATPSVPAGSGLQMAAKGHRTPPQEMPGMQPMTTQPVSPRAASPPPPPAPPAATQPVASPAPVAAQQAPPVQQPSSPGSMMRAESSSSVPQRRLPASSKFRSSASAPASAPRPTPTTGKSKKSAVLTTVIVVVSVAVGAALGSFVLSIL